MKKALITGITGQDGSYLAELLLTKGYQVYGWVKKPVESDDTGFLAPIIDKLELVALDQTNPQEVKASLDKIRPTELYHFAAQSYAGNDKDLELQTTKFNIQSTHNILAQVRSLGLETQVLVSTSIHIFGNHTEGLITTETPLNPVSMYGISKATCQMLIGYYREVEKLNCRAAILSNHESPRRGPRFVTQKIIMTAHKIIKQGQREPLELGFLDVKRDWGFAPEFVEGLWKFNSTGINQDLFFATGKYHTVREFVELTFKELGVEIEWSGPRGTVEETGLDKSTGKKLVVINPEFFRPVKEETQALDIQTTQKLLVWKAQTQLSDIVKFMLNSLD